MLYYIPCIYVYKLQHLKESDEYNIDWENINPEIHEHIQSDMGNVKNNIYSQAETWKELIENNFWIAYFMCLLRIDYNDTDRSGS